MATLNFTPDNVINFLKKGALIYSYENKIPIQLIISKNKEIAVNEKKFSAKFGTPIITYYSKPIIPDQYYDLDEYIKDVTNCWEESCNKVYNCEATDTNLEPNDIESRTYPLVINNVIRTALLIFTRFSIVKIISWLF